MCHPGAVLAAQKVFVCMVKSDKAFCSCVLWLPPSQTGSSCNSGCLQKLKRKTMH